MNELNTIKAVQALSNLLDAVDQVDTLSLTLHGAIERRALSLTALRSMGFTSMQSGKAARYQTKGAPIASTEYPYAAAKAEFLKRIANKEEAAAAKAKETKTTYKPLTAAKIDNIVKQNISSLNVWLVTGKFTTNVGRDLPRIEAEVAAELSKKLDFEAKHSALKAKAGKAEMVEAAKVVKVAEKAATIAHNAVIVATKSNDSAAIKTAEKANEKAKVDMIAAQTLASHAKKAADLLEANRAKAAEAATKAKADLSVKTEKVQSKKVQASDSKVNSNAGCSRECQLEALELFVMLEEDNTSLAVMLELARLITAKYR